MDLIEAFNRTIDHWITQIPNYSLKELQTKSDPQSWSLGQVYRHLIEETIWYNEQIVLSLTDTKNRNEEMTDQAKAMFAANEFPDVRIIGDPLISDKVPQPESVEQLIHDMEKLKADTVALWQKIRADTEGKSKHPGLGYFTALEWFQYMEMHMRHHLRQKAKLDAYLN
ncbi:MAG: DinB family protein [Cyclobacteriaceae bacterium]|jgi:hypothetical protein|nr:DinB family protein [Cyclobacteriaceae bacterium]